MQAGKLRHRVDIEYETTTQNEYGEPMGVWVKLYTAKPASIDPISGREFFSAEKVNSEITHKIRVRYAENIHSKMRVVFGSRIFNIISVINWEERNIELMLMGKELK
jgi:SPP1 family predicted phage head-tail adaptor